MLLQSQLYLSESPVDDAVRPRTRSGWLRPLWVVPRAWCATTSLQAKGVPRHKTAAFVRLQLSRLAPFVDCGAYACRAGDLVHIWFWENQRIRAFCAENELDFDSMRLAPESVCLPKTLEGAVQHQCVEGVEAQLWHQGLLLDSAWWSTSPDDETWKAWRASALESMPARNTLASWPEVLPRMMRLPSGSARLSRPWASNLLGQQWWRNLKAFRLGIALVLIAALMCGLAGFWAAQLWVLHSAQNKIEKKIASLSARVDPLNDARTKALDHLQWTSRVSKLRGNEEGLSDILKDLQPVLEQQEAALREFDYTEGELRLLLVGLNGELNSEAIVQQFEAMPRLVHIRLLPSNDVRLLHVSTKLRQTATPDKNTNPLKSLQFSSHSAPLPQSKVPPADNKVGAK